MNRKRKIWTGTLCALTMLVLILDTKTALSGAKEGINLCLYTIVPSLFPFFILSILINCAIVGSKVKILRPIGKLCGIPAGAESILILGMVGGYPVGAQSIAQAWHEGRLKKEDARRMLGFCSNAGPAFLFGMTASLFTSSAAAWFLWVIHILSALIVGMLLPKKSDWKCYTGSSKNVSFINALEQSIRILASVCGWVVIFRIILAFLNRWFLWFLSADTNIAITGLLELSNGCIALGSIAAEGGRFVFMAGFLGFGGSCVAAQTVSVTKDLGTGYYFPGKIMQGIISAIFAYILQFLLFSSEQLYIIPVYALLVPLALAAGMLFFIRSKKTVAFQKNMMYNELRFYS